MKKLTLTWIKREEKVGKNNKPYTSLSIRAKEYGERYLSGFGSAANAGWAVGQEVEVADVKEVASKDGTKTYLNFEMPKKADPNVEVAALRVSMDELNRKFERMREAMAPIWKDWNARTTTKSVQSFPGMNEKEVAEVNSTLIPDFNPEEINYPEETEAEVINF